MMLSYRNILRYYSSAYVDGYLCASKNEIAFLLMLQCDLRWFYLFFFFLGLVAPNTHHASRCGAGFIWWSPLHLYCGPWWSCGQAWFTATRRWTSWGTKRKWEHLFAFQLAILHSPLIVLLLALWWGGMVRWSHGLAGLQIIFLAGFGAAPVCSYNNTVTFASCQP